MVMHAGTLISDVSLAQEFQKHLSSAVQKHGVIDQVKHKKRASKKIGQKGNIVFRKMLMSRTNMLICFVIQTSFHHFHFVVHTKTTRYQRVEQAFPYKVLSQTRTWYMRNTTYTMCLCCM